MLLFTLQLEALVITPTSPLVPYINWLYPRTQAPELVLQAVNHMHQDGSAMPIYYLEAVG